MNNFLVNLDPVLGSGTDSLNDWKGGTKDDIFEQAGPDRRGRKWNGFGDRQVAGEKGCVGDAGRTSAGEIGRRTRNIRLPLTT